ncbi:hypothetical protein C2W62_09605 [Candidatus Entotheonella serta]|nr:hypothetical protein C2W62_09605 [Candidatus Entotheonella serta]
MSTPLNMQQHRQATVLTLIHPIRADRIDQLREALQCLRQEELSVIRETLSIYALQWIMFDNNTRLLFAIHIEGAIETVFHHFATAGAETCRQIWGNCIGYPDGERHTVDAIIAYLSTGQVPTTAYFPRRDAQHH